MTAEDAELVSDAFARIGWHKPSEMFLRYVAEARTGDRVCLLAEHGKEFMGYGTLLWTSG